MCFHHHHHHPLLIIRKLPLSQRPETLSSEMVQRIIFSSSSLDHDSIVDDGWRDERSNSVNNKPTSKLQSLSPDKEMKLKFGKINMIASSDESTEVNKIYGNKKLMPLDERVERAAHQSESIITWKVEGTSKTKRNNEKAILYRIFILLAFSLDLWTAVTG